MNELYSKTTTIHSSLRDKSITLLRIFDVIPTSGCIMYGFCGELRGEFIESFMVSLKRNFMTSFLLLCSKRSWKPLKNRTSSTKLNHMLTIDFDICLIESSWRIFHAFYKKKPRQNFIIGVHFCCVIFHKNFVYVKVSTRKNSIENSHVFYLKILDFWRCHSTKNRFSHAVTFLTALHTYLSSIFHYTILSKYLSEKSITPLNIKNTVTQPNISISTTGHKNVSKASLMKISQENAPTFYTLAFSWLKFTGA